MARKDYNIDSVGRALAHHVEGGRLVSVSRVMGADPVRGKVFRIQGWSQNEPVELTVREAYLVCYGLASAQYGMEKG